MNSIREEKISQDNSIMMKNHSLTLSDVFKVMMLFCQYQTTQKELLLLWQDCRRLFLRGDWRNREKILSSDETAIFIATYLLKKHYFTLLNSTINVRPFYPHSWKNQGEKSRNPFTNIEIFWRIAVNYYIISRVFSTFSNTILLEYFFLNRDAAFLPWKSMCGIFPPTDYIF